MIISVNDISTQRLCIGYEGEQNHIQVVFDCGVVFAEYPEAYAQMAIKPPKGNIYPKTVTRDGDSVVWNVGAADCANPGNGEYQITFVNDETIVKSYIGFFAVRDSLVVNGEAPEPVEDWLEQVEAALATKLIDDSSTTATNRTWSANKLATEKSVLYESINAKQTAPASGAAAGKVLGLALVDGQLVPVWDGFPVSDVQVDGTSVVSSGMANIPLASSGSNLTFLNGELIVPPATNSQIKSGVNAIQQIAPSTQHRSVFYGLAKAAGDDTQSASENSIGTYTETAKSKISEMLDSPETVSGSTPSITAKAGVHYICGECSTLSFTPSATGVCDVVFTSGATPTVLTLPNTVKFPDAFDPTSLDANTVYEINILNGVYGLVSAWT